MVSIKLLLGITIFLLLVILVLLIWIAVLKFDNDMLKRNNLWLYEDVIELNAKLKIAMGLPVDVTNDKTSPWLYEPRNEEQKYDGFMGLG